MSKDVVRVVLDAAAVAELVRGDMLRLRGVTANGMVEVEVLLSKGGSAALRAALELVPIGTVRPIRWSPPGC